MLYRRDFYSLISMWLYSYDIVFFTCGVYVSYINTVLYVQFYVDVISIVLFGCDYIVVFWGDILFFRCDLYVIYIYTALYM